MKVAMQFGFHHEEGTRDERVIMEYFHQALVRSGADVAVLEEGDMDVSGYDLLHVFGLSANIHDLSREAAGRNIPVISTPFYWNEDYPVFYELDSLGRKAEPHIREKSLTASYFQKRILSDRFRQEKFVLGNAALVLVSGKCERMQVARDYEVAENKILELPVGIDLFMGVGKPEPFKEKFGVENFVLCLGQLIPRKNQHLLIDITRDLEMPLVIAGPEATDGGQYETHCRDLAHGGVHFVGDIETQMLKSAFQAARMFALPSAFELPGMAYLAAAVAGLPIVATCRGAAWEYLGDQACYCDPGDTASVFDAVMKCSGAQPSGELKKKLLENFSWGKTAVLLIRLYQKIIQISS